MQRRTAIKSFVGGLLGLFGIKAAASAIPVPLPPITKIFGCQWIITIKKDLVPDQKLYRFADPHFIGKQYVLHDVSWMPGTMAERGMQQFFPPEV